MRTCVVSDQEAIGARVRQVLSFEGHQCQSADVVPVARGTAHTAEARPELVVLVLSPEPDRALNVLGALRGEGRKVLAVGPASSKLVLRALRGGADDYIDEVELEAEVAAALTRLSTAAAGHDAAGRVIALLGPSGGSGSSTLAANVAAALAKAHKDVALIDLKLEAGDLAALLDLRPTYTLADLSQQVARVDQVMFERSLVRHDSGVHLLASPRVYADVPYVTPEAVARALALARAAFPYTVVDLDHSFHDIQVQALRQADVILLVLRLDFTALRNARRVLDHLDHLGVARDRLRVVVNRYGQPKEVPAAKAEEALGAKIFHYVPDDAKSVNRANNNGVPVVLEAPSARVSKSLYRLAASVNGHHKPK